MTEKPRLLHAPVQKPRRGDVNGPYLPQHALPEMQHSRPAAQQSLSLAFSPQQACGGKQQSRPAAQQSPAQQACGGLQQSAPAAQQSTPAWLQAETPPTPARLRPTTIAKPRNTFVNMVTSFSSSGNKG